MELIHFLLIELNFLAARTSWRATWKRVLQAIDVFFTQPKLNMFYSFYSKTHKHIKHFSELYRILRMARILKVCLFAGLKTTKTPHGRSPGRSLHELIHGLFFGLQGMVTIRHDHVWHLHFTARHQYQKLISTTVGGVAVSGWLWGGNATASVVPTIPTAAPWPWFDSIVSDPELILRNPLSSQVVLSPLHPTN